MRPVVAGQERKLPLTEGPQIFLPEPGGGGTLDLLKQATLESSNLGLMLRSVPEIYLFTAVGGQIVELHVSRGIADKVPLGRYNANGRAINPNVRHRAELGDDHGWRSTHGRRSHPKAPQTIPLRRGAPPSG